MSNLNEQDDERGYGVQHERSDTGVPSRDQSGHGDGDNSRRSNPPTPAPDGEPTDVARMDPYWQRPPEGDPGSRQQELPLGVIHHESLNFHSGPLPSADALAAYERARPGTADWIVETADMQAKTEADAIRTKAHSEGFALRTFAAGYIALPLAAIVAGVVLAAMHFEGGVIMAILGGVGAVVEAVGRSVGGMIRGRRNDDDT